MINFLFLTVVPPGRGDLHFTECSEDFVRAETTPTAAAGGGQRPARLYWCKAVCLHLCGKNVSVWDFSSNLFFFLPIYLFWNWVLFWRPNLLKHWISNGATYNTIRFSFINYKAFLVFNLTGFLRFYLMSPKPGRWIYSTSSVVVSLF